MRVTPRGKKAGAPNPCTVSVGKATSPPEFSNWRATSMARGCVVGKISVCIGPSSGGGDKNSLQAGQIADQGYCGFWELAAPPFIYGQSLGGTDLPAEQSGGLAAWPGLLRAAWDLL